MPIESGEGDLLALGDSSAGDPLPLFRIRFGVGAELVCSGSIREAAVLLPFVSHLRGDLYFVRDLLSSLFRCEVQLTIGRYSETDNTRSWLPSARYEMIMPDLSAEEYNCLMDDVRPLNEFVCEWFMPMEAKCFIDIKWKDIDLPQTPVLNYNTHLKK